MAAISAGVSPEGQKLYMVIAKTINQVSAFHAAARHACYLSIEEIICVCVFFCSNPQVTWVGENIVVFNDVTIKPPYRVEDVGGNPESRQLTYVKKIVEKFAVDQAAVAEVAT